MGSIRNPNFALFPGQGVKLGSAFGVVQRIRGDEAIVFFSDGERAVPIRELQRPVERGDYHAIEDDAEDADALNEEQELLEVEN